MSLQKRVVVTGLGQLSPLGNDYRTAWKNCVSGKNGITSAEFDIKDCPVQVAGRLFDFNVENYLPTKLSRRIDPFIQYGIVAANESIKDSGFL